MKRNRLLNPFERIAGWQALGWGLATILVAAIVGHLGGLHFDGAIDAHTAIDTSPFLVGDLGVSAPSLGRAVAMHLIDWLGITIVMWLAALIFYSGKFRMVDIAGTMAFARVPMLGVALLALLPIAPERIDLAGFSRLMLFGLLSMVFTVWMIVWMWKGFKVSCNARGVRGGVVFAGALIVAEIVVGQLYAALDWVPSVMDVLKNIQLPR